MFTDQQGRSAGGGLAKGLPRFANRSVANGASWGPTPALETGKVLTPLRRNPRLGGAAPAGLCGIKLMLQLLLTVAAIVWATCSVFASDEQDCFQGQEPQLRIKGFSEMLERAPEDAIAYHNRAFAYALAGAIDNAIAD